VHDESTENAHASQSSVVCTAALVKGPLSTKENNGWPRSQPQAHPLQRAHLDPLRGSACFGAAALLERARQVVKVSCGPKIGFGLIGIAALELCASADFDEEICNLLRI